MGKTSLAILAAILISGTLAVPRAAFAHCDTLDGPVIKAAQAALESGRVERVLSWVQKDGEAEIRDAFQKTLAVRALNPAAKELADTWFFETVVRVHRAGEGAPYTGLKPAGQSSGPAIPAADRALETGSLGPVDALLSSTMKRGLEERFHGVMERKRHEDNDVAAGRAYVEAYVAYIHYVENLYNAATGASGGHSAEGEPAGHSRDAGTAVEPEHQHPVR